MTGEAQAPQLERSPRSPQLGKNPCSNEVTAQPKANKYRTEFKIKKKRRKQGTDSMMWSHLCHVRAGNEFSDETQKERVEFIRV